MKIIFDYNHVKGNIFTKRNIQAFCQNMHHNFFNIFFQTHSIVVLSFKIFQKEQELKIIVLFTGFSNHQLTNVNSSKLVCFSFSQSGCYNDLPVMSYIMDTKVILETHAAIQSQINTMTNFQNEQHSLLLFFTGFYLLVKALLIKFCDGLFILNII